MSQNKTAKSINELILHHFWKAQSFSNANLETSDGSSLKIIFPGWYNNSWGPDFKEAKLMIGQDEFFGDVEIHTEESAWFSHGHHLDDHYKRVVLHVFVNPINTTKLSFNKIKIPSFQIKGVDLHHIEQKLYSKEPETIRDLPGVCGLTINNKNIKMVKRVIYQAAEDRMVKKVKHFSDLIADSNSYNDQEQIFYIGLLTALGQTNFQIKFKSLAELFPYKTYNNSFKKYKNDCRTEIMSKWFGMLGILDLPISNIQNEELRREWKLMRQIWERVTPPGGPLTSKNELPNRPLNNPVRRLYGLYYHLEKLHFQGLLKGWLSFLYETVPILDNNGRPSKEVFQKLDALFPQPQIVPQLSLKSKFKNNKPQRLIGRQRQLIILVNAVIPFFIALSRHNKDIALEKMLFQFYMLLPAEGDNRKTKFMEKRLLTKEYRNIIPGNLSYHQGLIQLHDDCCKSFYEGCANCSLLSRLT